ncbi:MAG: dihydroxyacetone kinase subunit DhaL [Caldilineales bacterium]
MIKREDVVTWLTCYRQVLKDNKDYLTELDSAIGDADHGANMDRGFNAVLAKLPTVEDKDIGTILKTTGMTLVSTVGGAGGPLYGTFFMRAGMAVDGKAELTPAELAAALDAGVAGVQQRGKATPGEKTMLDLLTPACAALHEALDGGADLKVSLDAAAAAAEQGMKDTIPMLATKGRASYLGERSIGHQDPGATSSFLLIQCAADCLGEE